MARTTHHTPYRHRRNDVPRAWTDHRLADLRYSQGTRRAAARERRRDLPESRVRGFAAYEYPRAANVDWKAASRPWERKARTRLRAERRHAEQALHATAKGGGSVEALLDAGEDVDFVPAVHRHTAAWDVA